MYEIMVAQCLRTTKTTLHTFTVTSHNMKIFFILVICSLTIFFSCSEKRDPNIVQIQFSLHSNEYLGFIMKQENDSLIIFLEGIHPDEKLQIREVRNESLKKIAQLKIDLIEICGGRNKETLEFNNPEEQKMVVEFMIKSQKGYELKRSLNNIVKFINKFDNQIYNIANDPRSIPGFPESEASKKTFSEIHFDYPTLVGALNTITTYELLMLQTENAFLNRLLIERGLNGL